VQLLNGGGRVYTVYVHSYLGYGLMAGRAAVLQQASLNASSTGHPCLSSAVTYAYGGASFDGKPSAAASADACIAVATAALNGDKACSPAPKPECGFDGAWGGGGGPGAQRFYVSSYFWDRASQAGLVSAGALSASVRPAQFKSAATVACSTPVAQLGGAFKDAPTGSPDASLFCLDVSYCHALLTRGFGLPEGAEITLVKQVEFRGEAVEAAWPLGAAVNSLG